MENGPFSSLSSSTGIQQNSHHYLPLLMTNGKSMSGSVFSLIGSGSDPVVTSRETAHGANGTNGTNGVRKDPRLISSLPSPSTTSSASADSKAANPTATITTPSEQGGRRPTPSPQDTTMASPKYNIPTDDISAKPGSDPTTVPALKPVSSVSSPTSKVQSSTKSDSSNSKPWSVTGAAGAASISAQADLIDGALSDFEGSDLSDLSSASSASGSDRDSEGGQDDEDDSSLDEAASDDSKMDENRGDSGSDDTSNSDDSDSQPMLASKKRPAAKKSIRPRIQSDSSDGEQNPGVSKRGPGRPPKAKQSIKSRSLRPPTTPTSLTFTSNTQAKKNGGASTEESTATESGSQANESQARKKTKQPDLAHIDKRDRSGRTQLFKYTAMGDLEACRSLIEAGAQVNDRDYAEWTPLHEACVTGHDKVAELLIQHGADVNARGGHADTPLHDAAQNGHVDVVKLLLSHGANVLAKNAKGIIPIDVSDDKEVIDLLQRRQALVNMLTGKNQAGQTMLHRACSSGSYNNVTDLLNQGADINAQDNAQWTPLHEAALAGHTEVVELLLSRGAQPNAKGHGNDTALHDASQNEHEDVVRLLLEYGADPDFKNSKGEKPCDVCEHDGILELLKSGARNTKKAVARAVDSPLYGSPSSSFALQSSKSGPNGFHSQSSIKGQDKSKRHKEGSADVNMSDDGRSASEERPTQMSRDERKMQQLLSTIRMQEQMEERKKAKKRRPKQVSEDEGDDDEDSKLSRSRSKDTTPTPSSTWKHSRTNSSSNTNNNNTPSNSSNNQHAKSSQSRPLTKAGKNGSRARSTRSEDRNDSDSGPDVSIHSKRSFQRSTGDRFRIDHRYKDSSGRTQLHQWAEAGDIEMVGNLLEGGAERDPKDHDGSTPLHLAAKAGNTEVLVLLLAYGSNVNAQDQEKTTALHEAVRYHHLEAVRLLLQNNAIVTLRDSMKRNCLDLSSSKDSEIRTLLKTSLDQAEAKAKERSNKRLSQSIETRGSPKHKERKTHRGSESDEPAKAKKRSSDRREGDEKKQHARNGSSVGHQKSNSMTAISVSHPKKLSSSSTTPTTTAPTSAVPWKTSSDMEGVETTAPLKKRQPSSQRPISLGPSSTLQPTEEEPEVRMSSGSSKKRRETDRHGDRYGGKIKIKKEREDDAQIFRAPGLSTKPDELRRVASTPSFSKDSINGKQSRYGSTKPPTSLSSSRPSSIFGMPLGSSIASISPPLTETSTSPPPPTSSTSISSQDSELQRSRKRSSQTFSSQSGYLKFQDDLKQATATKPQHQHQRQRSSASVSVPTSGSRPTGAAETFPLASSAAAVAAAISADVDVSRKKAKTSIADSITEPVSSKHPATAPVSSTTPANGTTEPIVPDIAMTQAAAPPLPPSANALTSTSPVSNSSTKEQASSVAEEPIKYSKVEEADNVVVKAESPPPVPRSAHDAQRYLPLYTVQLSNETDQVDPTASSATGPGLKSADSSQQQQHFCVVDRQVQLLLGLTGPGSLYSRYSHLHRRLVTPREKDRLWSPLSSMVSDRCAAAVKLNYEVLPVECQFSSWSTATTAMSRLKEHEKQKFLGCDLYFIRLDEVTELIRRDFPQLEDSMMTITLDIGYDEEFDMETDADQDLDLNKVKKEDETLKTVKEEVVEESVHLTTTSASSSSSLLTTTSLTSLATSVSSSSLSQQASQVEMISAANANATSVSSGASGFIHKLRRVPAKIATKAMFKELQQQYHRHS
ncbi:hypothetical protein BG015_005857 [Linnemannia schmuckeri]|uniref:DUF7593 domain-containing protein n=1 Tax=Linnemannia schmuckeri TaxID=64567 RepID=A0A9P5VC78_9FUNG|nr:hypothetical protein BG015_005857 [Linnemannia schmuckeri]